MTASLVNGVVGLFAARRMAAQLGGELGEDKRFVYPARMRYLTRAGFRCPPSP